MLFSFGFVTLFFGSIAIAHFEHRHVCRKMDAHFGWEGEYIDLLIERNIIDVLALLSRIEANDAAACVIREASRGEATSTSLEPKKKNEECKMKNPQINNECMEKILVQLVGAVM